MTGRVVALALLMAAIGWGTDCKSLYWPYDSEQKLLVAHAPSFIQWMHDADKEGPLDYFAPLNFDEAERPMRKWISNNNRENSHNSEFQDKLIPTVYGGLIAATANQLYLVYYVYHPEDRGDWFTRSVGDALGWLTGLGRGKHENDLEGGYLVVDRATQKAIHASALAHNGFDDRHLGKDSDFEAGYVVNVEAGKHGAHLIAKSEVKPERSYPGERGQFIGYYPSHTEQANRPEDAQPKKLLPQVLAMPPNGQAYRIQPLWPLFREMFENNRLIEGTRLWTSVKKYPEVSLLNPDDRKLMKRPARHSVFTALLGADDNQAKFPWGQREEMERFYDPVQNVWNTEPDPENSVHHKQHRQIAVGYEFNPYLATLLEGKLPTWTEENCPAFTSY